MRLRDLLLLAPLVVLAGALGAQMVWPGAWGSWLLGALVPATAAPLGLYLLLERRARARRRDCERR
ncbi:MAG: hypothetical protein KAG62_09395 [Caulobacter sp.]|nr:hypothetical protein [Caulobacter sp.]